MGQNGFQIVHGPDVLDLGHQEQPRRAFLPVVLKILAEDVGPAIAHAAIFRGGFARLAPTVLTGIHGPVNGPVELFPAFDHGKDQALGPGFQRGLDLAFCSLGQAGEGRGPAALNGPEDIRQAGAAEGAVFHVHGHPVVSGARHELGHVRGGQLQPGAHGGLVAGQQGADVMYCHMKTACRRGLGLRDDAA